MTRSTPPINKHHSAPARQRQPGVAALGLTSQQIVVLALVLVLGGAALALAAYAVLSTGQAPLATLAPASGLAVPSTPGVPSLPTISSVPAGTPATQASQENPLPQAACARQNQGAQLGTHARVMDGSTLEVQLDGKPVRVRYAGIDIPQPEQAASARWVSALLENQAAGNQSVLLLKDVSEQDAQGSLLRYVYVGDQFINAELVQLGLASTLPGTPDLSCSTVLQQAEQQARAGRLGMWGPTPVPTLTFLPTVGLDSSKTAPCDCSLRPTCSDFRTHAEAQACFNACNDYNSKLDEDRDNIACENLP